MANFNGTAGDDSYSGGSENDVINGYGGNDTLNGGSEPAGDPMFPPPPGDQIFAGPGNDLVHGNGGADFIDGESGNDTLYGDDGDDRITTWGDGNDLVYGGEGNDDLRNFFGGADGTVLLDGGAGNDTLTAIYGGTFTLNGGAGNDTFVVGRNTLATLALGQGADTVRIDYSQFDFTNRIVITDFDPSADSLVIDFHDLLYLRPDLGTANWDGSNPFAGGYVKLIQDGSDAVLLGDIDGGGDELIEFIRFENVSTASLGAAHFGGFNPNGSPTTGLFVNGTAMLDVLNGGAGPDQISGGGGNDIIHGGAGNDVIDGGDGNDEIYSESGSDVIHGGAGNDRLVSGSLHYPAYGGVEQFYGDAGDDFIEATGDFGSVRSILDGGDGNDTLRFAVGSNGVDARGGAGNDSFWLNGFGHTIADGGVGDDFFDLGSGLSFKLNLGAGSDTVSLIPFAYAPAAVTTITDFSAAADSFSFPYSQMLIGWTGTNPFDTGYLRLVRRGDDAVLQIDRNGGGDAYVDFFLLEDAGFQIFTAANFGGYQPSATIIEGNAIQDAANDLNGDGRSDIMFRHDNGAITNFLGTANGGILNNGDNVYSVVSTVWSLAGTGDFNGDGRDDVLWRNASGAVFDFLGTANGGVQNNGDNSFLQLNAGWTVSGIGDFNGDGRDDILFRDANGVIFDYLGTASGGFTGNTGNLYTDIADAWHVSGVGDFNGDGRDDILFRNDNGAITNFLGTANGGIQNNGDNIYTVVGAEWHIAGVGDFNGDGRDDILWRNDNGAVFTVLSTANGGIVNNGDNSYAAMSNVWHVEAIGDYNGDGRDDILWRHDNGTIIDWLGTTSGGFTDNSGNLFTAIALQWQVAPADALI